MTNLQQYLKTNKPSKVKRGSKTTAYIFEDKVLLRTIDPVKEAMVHGWFPDSEYLPEVLGTDLEDKDEAFSVYKSPRYLQGRSIKALVNKEDYETVYQPLRRMYAKADWSRDSYKWHDNFIADVTNCEGLKEELKEVLIQAYEACMAFSHKVRFEISPRNVAATKEGQLIVLDCFFIIS